MVHNVELKTFALQGCDPWLWDPSCLCVTTPEMEFLVRPHLCITYPSWCGLFILHCGEVIQLGFRSFSERRVLYIAVDLLCLWMKSASFYATILTCPPHISYWFCFCGDPWVIQKMCVCVCIIHMHIYILPRCAILILVEIFFKTLICHIFIGK